MKPTRSREDKAHTLLITATTVAVLGFAWSFLVGHSLLDLKPWTFLRRITKEYEAAARHPTNQTFSLTKQLQAPLIKASAYRGVIHKKLTLLAVNQVPDSRSARIRFSARPLASHKLYSPLRVVQRVHKPVFRQRASTPIVAQYSHHKNNASVQLSSTGSRRGYRYQHVHHYGLHQIKSYPDYYVVVSRTTLPCVRSFQTDAEPVTLAPRVHHREYTSPATVEPDGTRTQYHVEETTTEYQSAEYQ